MIKSTEAIVLNTRKYGESSLITTVFTREFGKKSLIVKGYRSTKGKKRHSYFQPMSIVEVVFYEKASRSLQTVSETSTGYLFKTLQTNPVRITLGLLTIEIFNSAVQEEEQNIPLYNFLREILVRMDIQTTGLIQLFIFYLLHLTRHLGFFPHDDTASDKGPVHFDISQGTLASSPSFRDSDKLVREFVNTDMERCLSLSFSQKDKREVIETMLQYYQYHLEGFREPASLAVFREIFD